MKYLCIKLKIDLIIVIIIFTNIIKYNCKINNNYNSNNLFF